jgi:hypothetical protein
VSCSAVNVCTAVGDAFYADVNINDHRPLAERWNGTAWTIQPTPAPSNELNSSRIPFVWGLESVSCTAPNACTAVGQYPTFSGNGESAFAERWDGASWTLQTTAVPDASNEALSGVSCLTGSTCTAVGTFGPVATGSFVTLAEQWNGSGWVVQPTPNPIDASGPGLLSVSCTTGGYCTAVGQAYDGNGNTVGIAEGYSPL